MSDQDSKRDGLKEGLSSSDGDIRVLFVLNAILSVLFAWTIVWGLSFMGAVTFELTTIAGVAVVLFLLTYVVTMT